MFDPVSLAIYVGLALVSQSLAARASRKKISDVEFPTNDPKRKQPYVAGTVEVSPQVVDWGDFKRSSVRTEFPSWFNWLLPVTALIDQIPFGYRYYIGMVLGLARGPNVILKALKMADRVIWEGSVTGGSFTVAKPGEFGAEGGVYAVCDFVPGSMSQTRNAYWNTIRPNVPAFRGTAAIYWHGPSAGDDPLGKIKYSGYIGRATIVKELKARIARFPDSLASGFEIVNGVHANFAEVIYELLTDPLELGLATSLVDTDSFVAAAETLADENFGCSFKWEEPTEYIDIITRLLETIDAALYSDLDTGKITLKLIRPDFDPEDLVEIDETKTGVELELDRSDPHNSVGEIRIPFTDVTNNFADGTALFQSLSNRNHQGNVVSVTLERFGLGDAAAANRVVTRDGRALVVPLKRGTLKTNRETYDFHVGQAFWLSWAPYELDRTVFRVLEIDYGTLEDGRITIKIVEDSNNPNDSQFGEVVTNTWTDPIVVTPSDDTIRTVQSIDTTAPPGSPAIGVRYLVPAGATGAWSGHTNEIATWNGTAWIFEPTDDLEHGVIFDEDSGKFYRWDGAAWVEVVTTAYNTIQEEGVDVTPRREVLNFVGSGVTVTDDAVNGRTNVTITNTTPDFDYKNSVRVASTGNENVSSAPSLIDGVTLTTGDRVLLKNQSTASQNGIYDFNGAGVALTRSTDADSSAEVTAGMLVPVAEGTVNADTFWLLTTNDPITLGTTGLVFAQFGAGASVSDGDKGDITVSSAGSTWTIDNDVVTYAKMQNVSAASRLLGRGSAGGAGDVQELTLGPGLAISGTQIVADGSGGGGTIIVQTALGLIEMIRGTNYQM